MTSKKHRMIVYGVAIQLLLIAIVCYAAFPVKAPEAPIRLMYHTNAGKVLFDHQIHASVDGFALDCMDCHHEHGGEEIEPVSCGMCHPPQPTGVTFPESCFDCHADASEIENPEIMGRADAMHKQCTQCHEGYGKGPLHNGFISDAEKERIKTEPNAWVDCNKCHVM